MTSLIVPHVVFPTTRVVLNILNLWMATHVESVALQLLAREADLFPQIPKVA